MIGYTLRRLGQAAIVVLGVTVLVFLLEHLIPGSLARAILGPRASGVEIAAFNRANGLDRPVVAQYLTFLSHLLHGNLGYSTALTRASTRSWSTSCRTTSSLSHRARTSAVDRNPARGSPGGAAEPGARPCGDGRRVSPLLHAFVLARAPSHRGVDDQLSRLSRRAPQAASAGGVLADPRALVLPVVTLTLVNVALFSRYMRSAAVDTLAQEYVRVARSKGLPARVILTRHVLRNSLVPVVTLLGLSIPAVLTTGLVVEYVFNFPGLGLTYFNAAVNADYPVELGITVLVGIATVLGSLLADLAYAVLDPRVRYV